MSSLYHLLLILLHATCNLVDLIYKTWVLIRLKVFNGDVHCGQRRHALDAESINLKLVQLNKIPAHIVIILGTEQPSFADLANIISWCIASGIRYISLYDHKGLLKRTEATLKNALIENKVNMEQIVWNQAFQKNGFSTNTCSNGYKNGGKFEKFHIHLLSYMDGPHTIVNAVKTLSTSDVATAAIDIDFLDNYLYNKFKLPAPDLAVVCGHLFCTYGLLPWHIRTTEFIVLETHYQVQLETFLRILFKYAKSEQRYGK